MRILTVILLCLLSGLCHGQENPNRMFGNLSGAIGERQGSISLDYFYNWSFFKSKKMEVGIGARFTSYFGSAKYYSSAPSNLSNMEKYTDSLLLQSPQVNALNIALNLGYRFSPKIGIGFSIDLGGVSFGSRKSGFYLNSVQGQSTTAKPTLYNLLLIGNNDIGSLNSEFYFRYFITSTVAAKVAYQYLFTEYTTETKVQEAPEPNDRFRNKASLFSIGITKQFKR